MSVYLGEHATDFKVKAFLHTNLVEAYVNEWLENNPTYFVLGMDFAPSESGRGSIVIYYKEGEQK